MKYKFRFAGAVQSPAHRPHLTLTRKGLTLTTDAVEMLGNPSHIEIGYDEYRKTVAIRRASKDCPNATTLHTSKRFGKCTAKNAYKLFPEMPEGRKLEVEKYGDMLIAKFGDNDAKTVG